MSLRRYDANFPSPLLGIDEVGTGAIAGPICAAGVVLSRGGEVLKELEQLGIKDSKQLTEANRVRIHRLLKGHSDVWSHVAWRYPEEISRLGHYHAIADMFNEIIKNYRAHHETTPGGCILIDGHRNPNVHATAHWIEKGDNRSMSIAAASVLAKVERDNHMVELASYYPEYTFAQHKGYLTKSHKEELEKYGSCDVHRQDTQPIKEINSLKGRSPSVA